MSQWFGRVRQVINNNELHLPNLPLPLPRFSCSPLLHKSCQSLRKRLQAEWAVWWVGGVASLCSLAVVCRCGKRHLCKWFHGAAVAIKSPALVWAAGNYNEITVIAANLTVAALTFVCAT